MYIYFAKKKIIECGKNILKDPEKILSLKKCKRDCCENISEEQ